MRKNIEALTPGTQYLETRRSQTCSFIVSLVSQLGFFPYSALKPRELPNGCIHCVLGCKQYGSAHGILSRCPWASLRSLNYASVPFKVCRDASGHLCALPEYQTLRTFSHSILFFLPASHLPPQLYPWLAISTIIHLCSNTRENCPKTIHIKE